jgi:hypothetical protein
LNDVLAPADLLDGTFDFLAPDFLLAGFDPFFDLAPGSSTSLLSVALDTSTLGHFGGSIVLLGEGHNDSGFREALPPVTLYLSATVVDENVNVPEPSSILLLLVGGILLILRVTLTGRNRC